MQFQFRDPFRHLNYDFSVELLKKVGHLRFRRVVGGADAGSSPLVAAGAADAAARSRFQLVAASREVGAADRPEHAADRQLREQALQRRSRAQNRSAGPDPGSSALFDQQVKKNRVANYRS